MSKFRTLGVAAILAFVAIGASSTTDAHPHRDRRNPLSAADSVQLDERGMVAAVGTTPLRSFQKGGGHHLEFHGPDSPGFAIEYRSDRTKLAWVRFDDIRRLHGPVAQLGPLNAQNEAWAKQVLSYSLGTRASSQVMAAVRRGEKGNHHVDGHDVEISAAGPFALVTIHHSRSLP